MTAQSAGDGLQTAGDQVSNTGRSCFSCCAIIVDYIPDDIRNCCGGMFERISGCCGGVIAYIGDTAPNFLESCGGACSRGCGSIVDILGRCGGACSEGFRCLADICSECNWSEIGRCLMQVCSVLGSILQCLGGILRGFR